MPSSEKFENPILVTSSTRDPLVPLDPEDAPTMLNKDKAHRPLPLCRKILFGLAAPPLQMTGNICGFFFSLFLLEVVHMSPLMVSAITFSGRAWDAVTDPLVGQLVFRTKSRIGRTKPWLIVATLAGPVTFFFMWLHFPALESDWSKFLYYLFCYLAYSALITCYHVPYTSSTVLISNNAKDKDGATAARIGFELLFTIIGSGVFGVIISQKRLASNCDAAASINGTDLEIRIAEERQSYVLGAGTISAIYFFCGLFAIFGIKERVRLDNRRDSFFTNIRCVLTFRPYVLLMLAFLFMSLGIQIVQANLGLYTTHSVGLGSHMNYGIMTVLSIAVLCVPIWYKLADRFGKKKIFMCGLMPMFPCLLFATFMPSESKFCYYAVCAVSGVSISVAMLMPWSMLPDVIDDYYVLNGERKESMFYSLYVFFTKFASGISLALSQLALSASKYDSNSCAQSESVGMALRYLVGPGPVFCLAASLILMWFYPIDKAYRKELDRKLLDKENLGDSGSDEGVAMGLSGKLIDEEREDEEAAAVQCMPCLATSCTEAQAPQPQPQQQQQPDARSSGSADSGSSDSGLAVEVASTESLVVANKDYDNNKS